MAREDLVIMGRLLALLTLFTAAGSSLGCAQPTKDQLLKRAAFDLRCTKDELRVTKIDSRTRGVRGCGQQATYVQSCDQIGNGMVGSCTWVMNTRGRDDDGDDEE